MPSAKVLEEKQKVVADLAERIKSSAAGVLVNYQGITVADDTALRAELRKAGVNYTVIKNTLISKACDIVGFEGLKDVLSGMTAIATSEEDAVAPARIINDFAKKNENYTIKAGFVEGELLDVKGVEELAAIPTKDVLIARFMVRRCTGSPTPCRQSSTRTAKASLQRKTQRQKHLRKPDPKFAVLQQKPHNRNISVMQICRGALFLC